jgi:hypothetical protein
VNGRTVEALDIIGDTDDVLHDTANKRVYVFGGEGVHHHDRPGERHIVNGFGMDPARDRPDRRF